MFDSEFSTADDATVVAAIEEGARAEAAAGARRLAAIAELARRRVVDDDERANWAFDGWASAATEVDLVGDMNEGLTSMCARLYGNRSAGNRAKRALAAAAATEKRGAA